VVTAIGHTDDRLIADQVTDVATITPTAAGEYIVNSREEFLAGEITPLAQQLDAAYETFQQEHEHEQELAEAVDEAAPLRASRRSTTRPQSLCCLLLLVITGLWLGVI